MTTQYMVATRRSVALPYSRQLKLKFTHESKIRLPKKGP